MLAAISIRAWSLNCYDLQGVVGSFSTTNCSYGEDDEVAELVRIARAIAVTLPMKYSHTGSSSLRKPVSAILSDCAKAL
jgi:hypothetical protein